MIEKSYGNVLLTDAQALVNPVNCVGVMGKGLALGFKETYPNNFLEYKAACRAGEVRPGQMFITLTNNLANPHYIINFPTKRHWKESSYLEDIESGLVVLVADVRKLQLNSIAIPALGCELGGLDWKGVEPLIVDAFRSLPQVRVILFPPKG